LKKYSLLTSLSMELLSTQIPTVQQLTEMADQKAMPRSPLQQHHLAP
jgi:hypothetical protein